MVLHRNEISVGALPDWGLSDEGGKGERSEKGRTLLFWMLATGR